MKHLLLAALLLVCINAAAFRPENDDRNQDKARETAKTATAVIETKFQGEAIEAVEVGFAFNTVIKQSDKTGVQISIDSRLQSYLVCQLTDGRLILGMKSDRPQYLNYGACWVCKPTAVISVRKLNEIKADGAAKVEVQDIFEADSFKVRTGGAAKVNGLNVRTEGPVSIESSGASKLTGAQFGNPSKVSVDAGGASQISFTCHTTALSIDASGATRIEAAGSTAHLSADVSGAVQCQLDELKAQTAACSTSGAARIDCLATGDLSASASGASHITCKGNPHVLKKEASKASSINVL